MKFHWGHGIVTAALLFVCFISSMVYRSMQEKVDFVTPRYYEKELVYQDRINSEMNSNSLADNLKVGYKPGSVQIDYPQNIPVSQLSGEIAFYRPDNSLLDFTVPVQCNENHTQTVRTPGMKKGLWKVMISWKNGSTPYYFEQRIFAD
jgi:hypothetical protein